MSYYFFDTSAIIKRYVIEQGSTWVNSITARSGGHTILIAQITQVEIVSGAERRQCAGQISLRTAGAVRLLIDRHMRREFVVVVLSGDVVNRAEDLLALHPLRADDAIQLASALVSNARLTQTGQPPLIFVSADQRLLMAATSEGLAIDDPNLHP